MAVERPTGRSGRRAGKAARSRARRQPVGGRTAREAGQPPRKAARGEPRAATNFAKPTKVWDILEDWETAGTITFVGQIALRGTKIIAAVKPGREAFIGDLLRCEISLPDGRRVTLQQDPVAWFNNLPKNSMGSTVVVPHVEGPPRRAARVVGAPPRKAPKR